MALVPLYFFTLIFLGGCGKKCQQPPSKAFDSITATQWRLIETNMPNIMPVPVSNAPSTYRTLDRFTFEIWKFNVDGSASINQVEHNDQHDQPFLSFDYTSLKTDNGKQGVFTATFATPGTTGSDGTPQAGKTIGSVNYTYDLGRDLTLTDNQGHTFHFVQFTGVVPPDSTCTF
jgi:hypothetical protein